MTLAIVWGHMCGRTWAACSREIDRRKSCGALLRLRGYWDTLTQQAPHTRLASHSSRECFG